MDSSNMVVAISKERGQAIQVRGEGVTILVWRSVDEAVSYLDSVGRSSEQFELLQVDEEVRTRLAEVSRVRPEELNFVTYHTERGSSS
ncbi:MAG: hypothetical protein AAFZ38_11705 [Myxococcota bacterium]